MPQLRLFDGKAVEHFRARFGAFDVEDEDADLLGMDDVVVWVVVGTVGGADGKRTRDGAIRRTVTMDVSGARVVRGDMRDELVDIFQLDAGDPPLFVASPLPGVDPATGALDQNDEIAPRVPEEWAPPLVGLPATPHPAGVTAAERDPALAKFFAEASA